MGKKYSSFFFFFFFPMHGLFWMSLNWRAQDITTLHVYVPQILFSKCSFFLTNYSHQPLSGRITFNRNTYSKWKLNGKMENPSLIIQKYSVHKAAKLTRCGECLRSYSFWGIIPPSPGAVEKAIYQGKNIIKK